MQLGKEETRDGIEGENEGSRGVGRRVRLLRGARHYRSSFVRKKFLGSRNEEYALSNTCLDPRSSTSIEAPEDNEMSRRKEFSRS